MPDQEWPPVLTRQQAADMVKVSVSTLDLWRKNDDTFPYRRFGEHGSVRIPRDALLRWLEGNAA